MENNKLLEIKDLQVLFKTDDGIVKAVNGIDLSIEKGKTIGLVGETGAGKTTTALSIMRLIQTPPGKIVSGEIIFEGENLFEYSENDMESIRGSKISMIFQDPMTSLNPVMTVGDQISEVVQIHDNLDKKKSMEKAKEMLEMVGIPASRSHEYPHQFSGGMKQRVVIAMALACNPQLLIADEPTTALDVTIQAQVLNLMKDLREKYETSMIMITHDLGIVAEVCDEVSIVYGGEVIEHGNLVDIFDETKHPYTEGLFNSLPDINNRNIKLRPIKGQMPDPTQLPEGCCFHPRCGYAKEICSSRKPVKTVLNNTHYVKCLMYENTGTIFEGSVKNNE